MSAATALARSLTAEVRKTVGLPGAWLGAALAVVLPLLIEYYTDHDLAAQLAAGNPDAQRGWATSASLDCTWGPRGSWCWR